MSNEPLFMFVILAVGAVLIILMLGLGGFATGGEFNRKNSNKLMRLRIVAQFVAILGIMAFLWARGG